MAVLELLSQKTGSKGKLEIKAKGERSAELYILGDIVATIGDKWSQEDKCPMEVVEFLKEIEDKDELYIYINSGGGDAFAGKSIYESLKRSKAHKIAHIDGMAASAATMPLFAADEIIAPEGSLTMMHDPWTIAIGNATDLRKTAETMEKFEESYAQIYESRLKSGANVDIRQKMHEEWWISGKELAELFENVKTEETKAAACASAMFENYKRVPAGVIEPNDKKAAEKRKLMLMIEAI